MRVWKNLSKPKKAGIIIGAVAVVVAGAFLYRLLVQLPVTLDSGVRIQTIGNDERETAFRAFDIPLQEPATLTEIVDVESFREPYAYLYVEVDKDKNEAFETALLEHYERTDEPGYASQSGFFDHTEYASLTASDCVGRYVVPLGRYDAVCGSHGGCSVGFEAFCVVAGLERKLSQTRRMM